METNLSENVFAGARLRRLRDTLKLSAEAFVDELNLTGNRKPGGKVEVLSSKTIGRWEAGSSPITVACLVGLKRWLRDQGWRDHRNPRTGLFLLVFGIVDPDMSETDWTRRLERCRPMPGYKPSRRVAKIKKAERILEEQETERIIAEDSKRKANKLMDDVIRARARQLPEPTEGGEEA